MATSLGSGLCILQKVHRKSVLVSQPPEGRKPEKRAPFVLTLRHVLGSYSPNGVLEVVATRQAHFMHATYALTLCGLHGSPVKLGMDRLRQTFTCHGHLSNEMSELVPVD
jgi:hypothetical protein